MARAAHARTARATTVERLDLTLPPAVERTVVTDDGAALALTDAVPAKVTGRPILFAHGWTNNRAIWAPVARHLVDAGHRVVLYDQRGHGASTVGEEPLRVQRLGADMARILDDLDLRDVVVVGHSMGGFTTLAFACGHPDALHQRARGLALVSTAAHSVGFGRFGPAVATVVGPVLDWAISRPRMGQAMMRGMVGRRPEGSHISTTRAMYLETPRQVRVDSFNGFGGMDFRDQLPAVDVPAAVLVGSRDVLTPVRLGRSIARRIPGATLEVLPDAGHMLPLERPAEIVSAIRRLA